MQKFNQMLLDGQFLSVENIFHSTADYPSAEHLEELKLNARNNIETANLYLKTKIISASIIEALAIKTGALGIEGASQTSLFDFVNGIGTKIESNKSNSEIIPKRVKNSEIITEKTLQREVVSSTLSNRGDSSVAFGFDIPQSPVGKFIFENLQAKNIDELFKKNSILSNPENPYKEKLANAEVFLTDAEKILGSNKLLTIVKSVADLSDNKPTRKGVLDKIVSELEANAAEKSLRK